MENACVDFVVEMAAHKLVIGEMEFHNVYIFMRWTQGRGKIYGIVIVLILIDDWSICFGASWWILMHSDTSIQTKTWKYGYDVSKLTCKQAASSQKE